MNFRYKAYCYDNGHKNTPWISINQPVIRIGHSHSTTEFHIYGSDRNTEEKLQVTAVNHDALPDTHSVITLPFEFGAMADPIQEFIDRTTATSHRRQNECMKKFISDFEDVLPAVQTVRSGGLEVVNLDHLGMVNAISRLRQMLSNFKAEYPWVPGE